VTLLATVTESGCVTDYRALEGRVDDTLKTIAAVRQWRYRPAELDGESVAVQMTVTVTFSRQRAPAIGFPRSTWGACRLGSAVAFGAALSEPGARSSVLWQPSKSSRRAECPDVRTLAAISITRSSCPGTSIGSSSSPAADTIRGMRIKEDARYAGVRLTFRVLLPKSRVPNRRLRWERAP